MFLAWTPLITSDMFSGIQTDVLTTATGIIGILIVIVGVGMLARTFGR